MPRRRPRRIFVATVRAEGMTVPPHATPVIVFTLACGHTETRLRALYPHWQEGQAPPVGALVCRQCSHDD